MSTDSPLERLKVEAERWIAGVTTDSSLSGIAASGVRDIVGRAHELGLSARSKKGTTGAPRVGDLGASGPGTGEAVQTRSPTCSPSGDAPSNDKRELLPCPFCGHKPDLGDPDTLYPSGTMWRFNAELGMRTYHSFSERHLGDGHCFAMHCTRCPAEVSGDTREDAMRAWNRRSTPSASGTTDSPFHPYCNKCGKPAPSSGGCQRTDCGIRRSDRNANTE